MSDFCLTVFPESTSAHVVTTSVWVGVWVVVLFHLRLGWNLSGLVVPGYLVPLLLIRPLSVGVILLEAALTYFLVRFLSEAPKRTGYWCSFFGRDRFFALVLFSVLVRLACDVWIWPLMSDLAYRWLDIDIDHSSQLNSYGLIVVPLIANSFWKPGFWRGLTPLGISILVTYAIVRYLLIAWTNLSFGSLHYLYEDIASSLLTSPKAYVILLCTALIASWLNLRYAWEYNGILIPALLALQCYQAHKIVASFVEASVILLVGHYLLRLPLFRGITMEGARKTLLFFNVAFVYRLLLAWGLVYWFPDVKVTDAQGFGYLLSTLLAVRFHSTGHGGRIASATVQVALLGAVLGNVIGFALQWVPWSPSPPGHSEDVAVVRGHKIDGDLVSALRREKMVLYQNQLALRSARFTGTQRDSFIAGLRKLSQYGSQRQPRLLQSARHFFDAAGFQMDIIEQRYVLLRPTRPTSAWGLYVVDTEQTSGVSIQVPAPLHDDYAFESALTLFRLLPAQTLAIAGGTSHPQDPVPDVLLHRDTAYQTFHTTLALHRGLQIRGERDPRDEERGSIDDGRTSHLWITGGLPDGLPLARLQSLVGELAVHWSQSPSRNVVRDAASTGYAELFLTMADRRRLLARSSFGPHVPAADVIYLDASLERWLLDRKQDIATSGSQAYVPPKAEELLYFDDEVIRPWIECAAAAPATGNVPADLVDRLRPVAQACQAHGYRIGWLADPSAERNYLVLFEVSPSHRHWGTYVLACGLASPLVWEVSRPLYERYTVEAGISLFQQEGTALLVAGANPRANADGSADVSHIANKQSLFNLVHQALLREISPRRMTVVQLRSIRNPVHVDVVVATDEGPTSPADLSPAKQDVLRRLGDLGFTSALADGSPETAGYELGYTAQLAAQRQTGMPEFMSLWLSPSVRLRYRQQEDNQLLDAAMSALGVATVEDKLHDYLVRADRSPHTKAVPPQVIDEMLAFLQHRDIVALRRLQTLSATRSMTRLIDESSRQAFLLIETDPDHYPIVLNLGTDLDRPYRCAQLDRARVRHFIDARLAWLEVTVIP